MLEKEMTENSEMSKRVQGHPFCNKKGLKKKWSLLRGDNYLEFYCLCASKTWPDKRSTLCKESP